MAFLSKEDYEEPCCPLNMGTVTPIPLDRVLKKLDDYLDRNDYAAAEKHLDFWLGEADVAGDQRGKLTVLNERIGLMRKLGRAEDALKAADAALKHAERLSLSGTIVMGTTLLNAATACKAFGQPERALDLYTRAQTIYESQLEPADTRFGGLYNNMALALTDLKRWDEAKALYRKALAVMAAVPHGEADMAITHCNLADLASLELAPEDAEETVVAELDEAWRLLNAEGLPRDGYYAFVCEKCATAFGYHGQFLRDRELKRRAVAIRERA